MGTPSSAPPRAYICQKKRSPSGERKKFSRLKLRRRESCQSSRQGPPWERMASAARASRVLRTGQRRGKQAERGRGKPVRRSQVSPRRRTVTSLPQTSRLSV